jgi:hypothetical protein
MQPSEALGLAAQVAVALAGFAGVVVVFRPSAVHQWSNIDRFRLRLLLSNSVLPLIYSMIGILLLTIQPMPEQIWRWCSAMVIICTIPGVIFNARLIRKMGPVETKEINKVLFYPVSALGTAAILLQFYNAIVLNYFWAFFVVIVVHIITGILQFMQLVMLPTSPSSPQ